MFIFRYPGQSKFMDDLYERALRQVNDYFYTTTTSHYNATPEEEEEDIMEQSATHIKYVLDFPGIGPERVSVKLSSDREYISVAIDGVVQRKLLVPTIPGLKPEHISVKMEHGRLVISVERRGQVATKEDEVSLPINGKQFLQE